MIRDAVPADTSEICRLYACQRRRLPFIDDSDVAYSAARVRGPVGALSGACLYTLGNRLYVTALWTEDGFAGMRAAVELARDLDAMGQRLGKDLLFGVPVENHAFIRTVRTAGYEVTHVELQKRRYVSSVPQV